MPNDAKLPEQIYVITIDDKGSVTGHASLQELVEYEYHEGLSKFSEMHVGVYRLERQGRLTPQFVTEEKK